MTTLADSVRETLISVLIFIGLNLGGVLAWLAVHADYGSTDCNRGPQKG